MSTEYRLESTELVANKLGVLFALTSQLSANSFLPEAKAC